MGGKFRDRLLWPDQRAMVVERARTMARAYREEALAAHAQLDAARKALAGVDLRVLKFADPQAAAAVRALLDGAAADPVTVLDHQFSEWGETWHADPPEFEFADDDWVPTQYAVQIVGINGNTLGDYRMKGTIKGRYIKRGNGSTFMYRVSELRALRTRTELRGGRGRKPATPVKYQ